MKIWLATLAIIMVIFYAGWAAFTVLAVSVNDPAPVHFSPAELQPAPVSLSLETDTTPLPPLFIAGELHSPPMTTGEAAKYNVLHKISNDDIDLIIN